MNETTPESVATEDRGAQAVNKSAARLYAILARGGRTGVIFRRGPSKQVQLIRWDLRNDTFVHGQWFKGRIYERRCDLSPSGRLLVYFAATNRAPYGSWTALSKPPFFTALALWPKGDAWGGGGMFEDEMALLLNHSPARDPKSFELANDFQLPSRMRVAPFGEWSGSGEDNPINRAIRHRDGWHMVDEGEGQYNNYSDGALYTFNRPQLLEKEGKNGRRLQELLHSVGRRNRAWYNLTHRVVDREGRVLLELPGNDWADWDGGDLVFARYGCLYRLPKSGFKDYAQRGKEAFRLLHDFTSARFTLVSPTAEALKY
jgi:hypothetical protein